MRASAYCPSATLHQLLDLSLAFAPEYGGGLSSHLPMALSALDGLGATDQRLRLFFDSYTSRLRPRQVLPPSPDNHDWRVLRGDAQALPMLERAFSLALARDGRDAVLRSAMPELVTGVGAAALHGVIRVAHAVEARHERELAAALGYWASRWFPLSPPLPSDSAFGDAATWLDAMDAHRAREEAGWSPSGDLIVERMVDASRTETYRAFAGRSGIDNSPADWLAGLARAAAARYSRSRNFTVLHLCTGARAARVLAPWLVAKGVDLAPLAHAMAAANLASNVAADQLYSLSATLLDWPAAIAQACTSDDDHVIKLVHAMATQDSIDPAPEWLAAANAAVGT
ncbi:questin oxidase family protein [soil metagenome]